MKWQAFHVPRTAHISLFLLPWLSTSQIPKAVREAIFIHALGVRNRFLIQAPVQKDILNMSTVLRKSKYFSSPTKVTCLKLDTCLKYFSELGSALILRHEVFLFQLFYDYIFGLYYNNEKENGYIHFELLR